MSSVSINGVKYSGNNIVINGTSIIIDGNNVSFKDEKIVNIVIIGDVQKIDIDSCESLSVKGNAGSINTVSGDVQCGNVNGDVKTVSGDVSCGYIAGNVKTVSGDVK